MNPKYTEFRFPQIKAHPWNRVFRARTEQSALDLVDALLVYDPTTRVTAIEAAKVRLFCFFFCSLQSARLSLVVHVFLSTDRALAARIL